MYGDFRNDLFSITSTDEAIFHTFSGENKIIFLVSTQRMIRTVAKTCFKILQRRVFYLCKS